MNIKNYKNIDTKNLKCKIYKKSVENVFYTLFLCKNDKMCKK